MSAATPDDWSVYIVQCADGSLYTGVAKDVSKRVDQHNHNTLGAKYTRARRPVVLVYQESFGCRSDAQKREYQIKQLGRDEKLKILAQVRSQA